MLAILSLASCKQPLHERQIETVGELMDSLINRGEQVYRYIICGGDSTYQDVHYFYDEKNKNVRQSSLLFLADKTPDLLDKLCRKAEKSYRYWEGDSLDYSITMHSKPLELLSFKHYKNEKDEEVVSLSHTTKKYAQHLSAPYDPQPIQAVLQKFLSDQKDVKTSATNGTKVCPSPTSRTNSSTFDTKALAQTHWPRQRLQARSTPFPSKEKAAAMNCRQNLTSA